MLDITKALKSEYIIYNNCKYLEHWRILIQAYFCNLYSILFIVFQISYADNLLVFFAFLNIVAFSPNILVFLNLFLKFFFSSLILFLFFFLFSIIDICEFENTRILFFLSSFLFASSDKGNKFRLFR